MSESFVGQIKMFAGNFAPRGFALCDGQLLQVSQNDALFSLLGTTYGGDGRTTFALPELRGRVPIHQGQGPGLTNRNIGAKAGVEQVTLTTNQLPAHNHAANAAQGGSTGTPVGNHWSTDPAGSSAGYNTGQNAAMRADAIGNSGGGAAHSNMQPILAVNFIIALFGIYPSPT